MFEIVFSDAKLFKNCIDALVTLIDEGEFEISPEGMRLRAMDPSQIAMVDFFLPKSAAEKFTVSKETRVGLNLDDLSKVVSRTRPDEKLTLAFDEGKNRVELTFKGKAKRKFNLPLFDVSGSTPKQPRIEFDSKVRLAGGLLKESLKDTSLVSSHVAVKADAEGFSIESHGDKGEVLIEARKDEDTLLEHTVNRESKAIFPLEYLNDLLRTTESDTVVTLDLKTDAPLRLEYPIGEAKVVYYLAPRIESG